MKLSSAAILLVSVLTGASLSDAFTISSTCTNIQNHELIPRSSSLSSSSKSNVQFGLQMAASSDAEENDNLVTNEMFMREMLSHPDDHDDEEEREINKDAKVKRKKRNGKHYRTLDNRDSLPFIVKVATPDPYTSNAQMHSEAKLNI